ncbi:uncharacterized protein LOC116351412 [Contarinia nasturtii]|uniref:uncharacterized protein LOC116351412 n=1 Tax=Contarinia nasturtii TaxID=265458 RepID=UPI0012D38720|nr:uncharacterized protein LOC116351412 [Contarinia nasturtii]
MQRASRLILFVASFAFTYAVREQGKEFCFMKEDHQSKQFNFEYDLDHGEKFHGKTTFLFENNDSSAQMSLFYHLLLDATGDIHWVAFSENDLNSTVQFSKTVFPVMRTDDGIEFQNDYVRFLVTIGETSLKIYPYITEWDLQNICFKKINDSHSIFRYEISSLNNRRIYIGETFNEEGDGLLSKRIHISDPGQSDSIFRVDFKQDEFNSHTTFCRAISEIISQYFVLGAGQVNGIDPNALKSLVG